MFQRTEDAQGQWTTRCLDCFRILTDGSDGVDTLKQAERLEQLHLCPQRVLAESRQGEPPERLAKPRA